MSDSGQQSDARGTARTRRSIVLDHAVGALLPLACLALDPIVFHRWIPGDQSDDPALLEDLQTFAYGGIILEIALLAVWLLAPNASRRFAALFGGAFALGAAASLALGVRLLPLSTFGSIALIGLLGFSPFFVAFVFARNARRAFAAAKPRGGVSLVGGGLLGALLTLVVPLACYAFIEPFSFRLLYTSPNSLAWTRVAFSPGSGSVASADANGIVRLWDVASGNAIWTVEGHNGAINSLDCAAHIVVTAGADRALRVWDAASGRLVAALAPPRGEAVTSIALSADAGRLASGGEDGRVLLWSVDTGKWREVGRHDGTVNAVALSPDETRVASAGNDGIVRVWSVDGDTPPVEFRRHTGETTAVAFAPDGRGIASGSGRLDRRTAYPQGELFVWNADSRDIVTTIHPYFVGYALDVKFSADGSRIAVGGWSLGGRARTEWLHVNVIDAATEDSAHTLDADGLRWSVGASVAFSPDGLLLATGARDGGVLLWDPETGSLVHTFSTR